MEIVQGVIELSLLVGLLVVAREVRLLRREIPAIKGAILQPKLLDFPASPPSSASWRRRLP